jgi:hypothetical protein
MKPRLTTALAFMLLISLLIGTGLVSDSGTSGRRVGTTSAPMCGLKTTAPTYHHVIWIFEENNSYSSIIGAPAAPYANSLANACGLATNYHNISHHSLPNYIGVTSGLSLAALKPFYNDCTPPGGSCESSAASIFTQGPWKSYAEAMTSNCDKLGTPTYVNRHNPAVYYTGLSSCSTDDVPLGTTSSSTLLDNLKSESTTPAFSFVTPDICDDMHGAASAGCTTNLVGKGDSWLKTWMALMTATPVYRSGDTAIFIVWDEGEGGSATAGESCYNSTTDVSCHVAMIAVAPSIKPGTKDSAMLSHYSLLKTTEDMLGYPELGQAGTATSFEAALNL